LGIAPPVVFLVDDDSSVRDSLRRLITSVRFIVEVFLSRLVDPTAHLDSASSQSHTRQAVVTPQNFDFRYPSWSTFSWGATTNSGVKSG